MKSKIKNVYGAFWRGVAVGVAVSIISAVGMYIVIKPASVDIAIAAVSIINALVLLKDGGFNYD